MGATGTSRELFGRTAGGSPVDKITLVNAHGCELEVLTLGAIVRALRVPDRDGILDDVVLGYDRLGDYATDPYFMGAVIGRYANRIAYGRFSLEGRVHELPVNNGPHHLHGGDGGFHAVLWHADIAAPATVHLARTSPDGEAGYPGNVGVEIAYSLTDENEFTVEYRASTDQPTPINLTQHSYFNLAGAGRSTVHEHELVIHADDYLPTTAEGIPLGHIEPVAGTEFDFTGRRPIGPRLSAGHPQIQQATGFDHCYVLRGADGTLRPAAELVEQRTGRGMEVWTTEPGMQLYTGQYLQALTGKDRRSYGRYGALCLETQHFPDSPNRPEFPPVILRPGEVFRSRTVYRFGQAG